MLLQDLKSLSKTITVSYIYPQQKWFSQNTLSDTHLCISWYHNTLQSLYTKRYFHRQQPARAILTNQANVSVFLPTAFSPTTQPTASDVKYRVHV